MTRTFRFTLLASTLLGGMAQAEAVTLTSSAGNAAVLQATGGSTASFAGLAGAPGLMTYGTAKAAVVALSETLYQDLKLVTDQVTAAVLCPYFVATGIANSHRNRPDDMKNDTGPTLSQLVAQAQSSKAVNSGKITPAMIAQTVFHAIDNNQFYIFSHPHALGNVATRMTDITEMRSPTDPFAERPDIGVLLKAKLRGG